MESAEYRYPTVEEALRRGWFIDATSDDIDLSGPDGSAENPYPVIAGVGK
jgi:hypothetical protein